MRNRLHLFLRSSSSSGKAFGYGLDDPGFFLGAEGTEFSSILRVQTCPEAHLASFKMSVGLSRQVKTAERRISHPNSSFPLPVNLYGL